GKEVRMEEKKPILNEAIKFNGDYNSRQNAFEKLTKAFQEIGIELISYSKENHITVTEGKDFYEVEVLISVPRYKDLFNSWQFDINKNINDGFYIDIDFKGNRALKSEAIALLDKTMREEGNLGAFGNLCGGIEKIRKDYCIRIIDENDCLTIDMSPKSDFGGHDFTFTIDKKTGKRSDVVVGEVLPE
ncbi:MAG: hypothetical protein PHF29_10370, partial [Candidatus Riflebacteria bacterium]|nr:hypothetical protein [Candidatus Riflebacteria bacterium]